MPRNLSQAGRRNVLATSADEPLLAMVEITHADLGDTPIRVINDTQPLVSRGQTFLACPFDVTLPDDVDGQIPQARLEVDNVGRELTQWLEVSRGGQGARCRLMFVLRSDPDVYEVDLTMDLTGLKITNLRASGVLGFKHTLGQRSVAKTFTPATAPGLW